MGQYFSVSEMGSVILWEETDLDSGIYSPKNFSPLVVTFDINPDTLLPENMEVVLPGTDLGVNKSYSGGGAGNRWSYITLDGGSPDNLHSPAIFASQHFSDDSYAPTVIFVRDSEGETSYIRVAELENNFCKSVQLGAYYSATLQCYYMFFRFIYEGGGTYFQYLLVRSPSPAQKLYLNFFYPSASPSYYLALTSPKSRYFDVNQSSVLKFSLRSSDGFELAVDAEVEAFGVVPSNWNFDPSTKTLTLLSSVSPKAVNIKARYETSHKTYSTTITFLVRVNNPYTGGGISQPNGGAGSYENGTFGDPSTSDDITADLQDGSTFGNASSSGTFTRYLVNNSYLEIFGDWLWNTSLGLAIAQEVIRFIYGDPSESIISLMSYPFQLTGLEGVSHEHRDFYWGNHNAGYQVPALLTTAGQFDWGTLTFDEYWGNFLDYSPYTRVQLYLPWGTGFVDVNPDEILPGTLSIKTVVEFDKGSCVHILSNQQGAVIGTYSGQCGKQIALMASDYSSKLARIAVMGAVAGGIAVGSAATGAMATTSNIASGNFGFRTGARGLGFGGGMSAPMLNEGVMIENVSSAVHPPLKIPKGSLATKKHPINISRSGAFTDGSAGLGVQFPYVILSRPTQSVPEEYGAYEGYPSNIYANLSELKGYTEVGEIHLAGFENITVDELNKLDELLKGGVIF